MAKPRFSEDSKQDAMHKIVVRGYSVKEVSDRLGHGYYAGSNALGFCVFGCCD